MPRTSRSWRPGGGQHFISRFIDRRFKLETQQDRNMYLGYLADSQKRWDWRWLSYALMSSHIHDGLIAGACAPESFYRSTHTRYAQQYQRRFGTLGPVFAGRPKNFEVKPSKLVRMVAYHHRNPVEAGVVGRPAHSQWTSHRAYLRLASPPPFLDIEWALDTLGFDDSPGGRTSFDEFVTDFDFDAHQESLHPGSDACTRAVRRPVAALEEERANVLLLTVARVCVVSSGDMKHGRCRRATAARRVLAHVLVHHFAGTVADAARILQQRRTTMVNLVNRSSAAERQWICAQAEQVVAELPATHLRCLSEMSVM